jgi:hypothetical protein
MLPPLGAEGIIWLKPEYEFFTSGIEAILEFEAPNCLIS